VAKRNIFASCVKELERRRTALGKERDKLRALVDEYEALKDSADDAYDNLTYAIQRLSEYA
jgi:hypothetical protein